MINLAKARAELDRLLGRPLSDQDWAFLEYNGTLGDIEEFGLEPQTVEMIRRMLAFGDPSARRERPSPMLPRELDPRRVAERVEAVSILLASEAARDPAVIAFRRSVLADHLLDRAEVGEWIERQGQQDGGPSMLLSVAVPASRIDLETKPGRILVKWRRKTLEATSASRPSLAYGVPDDAWSRDVPVRIGGTLDRLRELSEQLSRHYRWDQAQATIFVLTGAIPLVSPIRAKMEPNLMRPSATARVVLTIDPTASPAQVAKAYARVRSSWLGRYRALSPKHLRLATFLAERPGEETWAERLKTWNARASAPERYEGHQVSNFARDCKRAKKRLLDPAVNWRAVLGGELAED